MSAAVSLDLPSLEAAGGLQIQQNDALESLALPVLAFVGATPGVDIKLNPELTDLVAPSLATVDGHLYVLSNDAVVEISAPALEVINGNLAVANAGLEQLDLPMLGQIGGFLAIIGHDSLWSLNLQSLAGVGSYFELHDNEALPQCLVDAVLAQVLAAGGVGSYSIVTGNKDGCVCSEVDGELVPTCS